MRTLPVGEESSTQHACNQIQWCQNVQRDGEGQKEHPPSHTPTPLFRGGQCGTTMNLVHPTAQQCPLMAASSPFLSLLLLAVAVCAPDSRPHQAFSEDNRARYSFPGNKNKRAHWIQRESGGRVRKNSGRRHRQRTKKRQ